MAARLFEITEEDSFLVVATYLGELLDGGEVRDRAGPRVHIQTIP